MSTPSLLELTLSAFGNAVKKTTEYLNSYGSQVNIEYDSGATVSVVKDKVIYIEFKRNANDSTCPVNLYITFPTNVLAMISMVITSDDRNYAILNDKTYNDKVESDTKNLLATFTAGTKYTLLNTCGIFNSKSGEFTAKIWIYVLDWW